VNSFELRNTELIKEFNRYVREHPKVADQIPNDALIVLQLEGDEAFNSWARQLVESRQGEGQPLLVVKIKKLRPIRSRIQQLELEEASHRDIA
jgi:hypothetical protein